MTKLGSSLQQFFNKVCADIESREIKDTNERGVSSTHPGILMD